MAAHQRGGGETPGLSAGEIAACAAAIAGVAALAAAGYLLYLRRSPDVSGHGAPDLAAEAPAVGSGRAPDAFRPDPTAAVPASEREALRPATAGPVPLTD